MAIPFSSALYYPYIEIRDREWLRSACLFWESIRTIVPETMRNPYSDRFSRDLNDEGVLEPVRVSSDMEEIEELAPKVTEYLNDAAASGLLFPNAAKTTIYPDKLPLSVRHLIEIHPDKLPTVVRSQLEKALNADGWMELSPAFASYYLTLLATQLADRLGLGLITESTTADQLAAVIKRGKPLGANDAGSFYGRIGRHFEADGPRRDAPRDILPGLVIDLVIRNIKLPRDISAKRLIKFRNDHKGELSKFREHIGRLTENVPKIHSIQALQQAAHDEYESNVLPALKGLQQSLRAEGWDAGLSGFLKVAFLSTPPASVAIQAGAPPLVALLAGAGVSLVATAVHLTRQRKAVREKNPYSYVLSIDREL